MIKRELPATRSNVGTASTPRPLSSPSLADVSAKSQRTSDAARIQFNPRTVATVVHPYAQGAYTSDPNKTQRPPFRVRACHLCAVLFTAKSARLVGLQCSS